MTRHDLAQKATQHVRDIRMLSTQLSSNVLTERYDEAAERLLALKQAENLLAGCVAQLLPVSKTEVRQ